MTDQELKDLVASLAVSQRELTEQMKKTDEQMKKTDEQMKRTDEQMKRTDEQIDKIHIEIRENAKEMRENAKEMRENARKTDEQMRKTDEQMKKTDEKLERMGIHLGNISNNQGDVTEEYFVNSLKNRLQIGDMKFDVLLSGVELKTKKIRDEFDILLVNGNTLALIEVKYKVHPNLIDKLSKKIEHLRLMPSYKDYKIYAGVAGFSVPEDAILLAQEKGYFVLQRKGDIIEEISDNLIAS